MIYLEKNHFIGEGEIRFCYEHPLNDQFCVKIPRVETTRDYTEKELKYFKKLSKRSKVNFQFPFYADFRQEIDTNLGLGQVFDLVRDETTNEISKTLEYYLTKDNSIDDNKLEDALKILKKQMIKHKVFTRDLRARNICCRIKNDGTVELVIVDGIGHRDFFPFADWFYYFSKKKVNRTFKKWHFDSIEDQRKYLKI
ncbi:MAG: YrbL family protein [Flavobacteriaceae bacterium]|nr:YrbL family protein [Flavobacteriaceae bacterium]